MVISGKMTRLLLSAYLLLFLFLGCGGDDPVKIGFVGGLTGRVADLGIAGRDGAMLAVEEQNDAGGIDGRRIELIVRDDRHDPATAVKADRELIEAGVSAVIGHMTSAMSMVGSPVTNRAKVLMLSPTTSTNALTGIDDFFFRVYPYSAQTTVQLARHVVEVMGHRRVSVLYDTTNRAHTESAYRAFAREIERLGGVIAGATAFHSGPAVNFSGMAQSIMQESPDCLFLLANAMDSAMLCQQLHKQEHRIQVVSSDWSATDEIVQYGGASVEGLFFMHTIDRHSSAPAYKRFKKAFSDRFGRQPGFAASHAYDAAKILLAGLEKNPDRHALPETLRKIGSFSGLQGTIRFDENGDVVREHFPIRIRNGRFTVEE